MPTPPIFGAIVGDIAGSTYEVNNYKHEDCEIFREGSRFTDDSVLTLATADKFLYGGSYTDVFQVYGRRYPDAGFGGSFFGWMISEDPQPYNSWGNGSAMRVSPVGWVAEDLQWALDEAANSAAVTHDHPEGIKGAQAVAGLVYLARNGSTKEELRDFAESKIGYDLKQSLAEIRPSYSFDVSCQGSVPQAITAFLESSDFEDSIRKAISLGGDSDTIACITGSIAHAFYGEIPKWMIDYCERALDPALLSINEEFWLRFPPAGSQE